MLPRRPRRFDLYADTRSQVYGGISAETAATDAAISATAGRALVWRGRPATTFYHSSSGAELRRRHPRCAGRAVPSLGARSYDRTSPRHRWSRRVGTGHLAAVAGLGDVSTVRTLINGSGRVRYVWLAGGGPADQRQLRSPALGLPSAWFRIEPRATTPAPG